VRKILGIILILIVILVVVVLVAGGVLVRRPFPKVAGTLHVTGLEQPVEIVRDEWGIPHIYARTDHDLFFAQGYVHAQDRLWQMEFNRRVAPGRLSEVLGEVALGNDRFLRTLGMGPASEAEAATMDPDSRAMLDAYAAGINAFLAEGHPLPLEFTLLGFKPAAWRPADSIGWGKVMAWSLGHNMSAELLRADITAAVGEKRMQEITPGYPPGAPVIVPGRAGAMPATPGSSPLGRADYRDLPVAEVVAKVQGLESWLGHSAPDAGSNNWVVSGTRSSTGHPLLANDPHLGIQMPSIWYEIGLHCVELSANCHYQAVGASFPGAPSVIIGHNPWIAWGVTTLPADVQDLYIEKVNPDNPNQVEYQGRWEDVQVRREEIAVKGRDTPEVLEVRVTRHGPILNDVQEGLSEVMALQWIGLGDAPILPAALALDRARNWDEFRAALSGWSIAHQNFVYADVEGNIGYQSTGLVPVRAKGDGLMPVPGWTGEYEWTGVIPYDKMPFSYNPAEGYAMSANNRVADDSYPYHLGSDWDAGWRAERLAELLAAKQVFTPKDFAAMQADSFILPARDVVPRLTALQASDGQVQAAIERLKAWDSECTLDSIGCSQYQATMVYLLPGVFADELGAALSKRYVDSEWPVRTLTALLGDPTSFWWDDKTTADRTETRDDILLRALAEGNADLVQRLGSNAERWQWGRLHTGTFGHVMGGVKPLNLIFNRSVESAGSAEAPLATGVDPNDPYGVSWLPSYRQIVSLANWSESRSMHTTGQSGLPFNRHYADMLPAWRDVTYHPMLWSDAEVQTQGKSKLTLEP
jgi:penicillin amidase